MRRSSHAFGFCELHQKLLYLTRKQARKVARSHKEDHKSVYECPVHPKLYHVGGVPDEVIRGEMTRSEYFKDAS